MTQSTPVIQVDALGKAYRLGARSDRPETTVAAIKAALLSPFRNAKNIRNLDTLGRRGGQSDDLFWALKDVSFTINEGEVVGIIGRNGAGKSTLLKILSRITMPSTGTAVLDGRVCSLLEVGTGFHPDLTGRENVYMNGTILGMRKEEIDKKFDQIVEFSGVGAFLDTPTKRYSSGMQVRLAFAVAAHLEPEILIVDEVLAVGDHEFQKRCLGKMKEVASSGRTVLFVSHNMHAVQNLTQRAILLDQGQVQQIGGTADVVKSYLDNATNNSDTPHPLNTYRRKLSGDDLVRIEKIELAVGKDDGSIPRVESGTKLTVRLEIEAIEATKGMFLTLGLNRDGQDFVGTAFSGDQNFRVNLEPGIHTVECQLPEMVLSPGRYLVSAGLGRSTTALADDYVIDYPLFDLFIPRLERAEVEWPNRPWGVLDLSNAQWDVRSK